MKKLIYLNLISLFLAVFSMAFIAPFMYFSKTIDGKILIFTKNVYTLSEIGLGLTFFAFGIGALFAKNRILKVIALSLSIFTCLVFVFIAGYGMSGLFAIEKIHVFKIIIPVFFISLFFIGLLFSQTPNHLQNLVLQNKSEEATDQITDVLVKDDLKIKISKLKTNLSKPSFEILQEIDSTGSFSGIDIQKIIGIDENIGESNDESSKGPEDLKIINPNSENFVKKNSQSPEKISDSDGKDSNKNKKIIQEHNYDFIDLTELSFEKNKEKDDFEIITPRRLDGKNETELKKDLNE
ncbi:hypothetical protein SSABA_v1c01390 [Spiroplasma sabaudiense Ar-1343]|uniref:Transmembrane protein n=1 Tax=Spiroplasma sabaudiense Ar-1343 TaxID=1276257 RepID=W6A995_9MOLU|nr:hypothetical protein [Spiroplasma sabaudiense]AHI53551.1 hypothetical protein SSABA_v1c01390 [Spiroplasma sabaudiense Ar-1343]